ncbi:uncharacterized protein LOC142975225 [Anticarsia gemmatalis]|uniref:uncharacterized protein LOC142975225 n=1 Tax=Anticarsia gemmatalis TaxID=129554 RepID=UPI003F770C8A
MAPADDGDESAPPVPPPTPADVAVFIVYASEQFQAEYNLKIIVQIEDYNPNEKKARVQSKHDQLALIQDDDICSSAMDGIGDPDALELVLMLDRSLKLTECLMSRCLRVPRLLIKIIAFCIPFHPNFNRITLRRCRLDAPCLYEVSKLLYHDHSKITELWLDDSPVIRRNYYVLLEKPSRLRLLSLARCWLDDDDCTTIFSFLDYPKPASKTLNILILSGNRISDRSACVLGEVLRKNRSLHYINLAGNRITSLGAICIFNSLKEFRLSPAELREKRQKLMSYHQLKKDVYKSCLATIMTEKPKEFDSSARKSQGRLVSPRARKVPSLDASMTRVMMQQKAYALAIDTIGEFMHPFTSDQTTTHDDVTYSMGNMALVSLNLSYNNLDYSSLPVLLEVAEYQNDASKKIGVLRVQVDGNKLPENCVEYRYIEEHLDRMIIRVTPLTPSQKKAADKRKMMSRKDILTK